MESPKRQISPSDSGVAAQRQKTFHFDQEDTNMSNGSSANVKKKKKQLVNKSPSRKLLKNRRQSVQERNNESEEAGRFRTELSKARAEMARSWKKSSESSASENLKFRDKRRIVKPV